MHAIISYRSVVIVATPLFHMSPLPVQRHLEREEFQIIYFNISRDMRIFEISMHRQDGRVMGGVIERSP